MRPRARTLEALQETSESAENRSSVALTTADLEARVAARTRQLQEANRELEDFAHTVSHDLRAPLRHIESFAALLIRHLETQPEALDEKSRHYLKRITDAAQSMGTLLEDLLTYSRLAHQEMHCTTVDLDRMLASLVGSQALPCEVTPLGKVQGDPTLLRQAFQHLLANAAKFSAPRADPHIWVRQAGTEAGRLVLEVGDNGVGYDPAFTDKLFGIFQRLHPREDFDGNGIGLAIVARIVQRHGGRVWAECPPGQGARFLLTLDPVAEP